MEEIEQYDDQAIEQLAREQMELNNNPDPMQAELLDQIKQEENPEPASTIEIATPKRKRSGKNQREKAQLYQAVDVLAQELEQLKFENEQLRAQNVYKDKLTANYLDDSLESKIEQAKSIYKQAIEEGDIDRQADAQQVIAQLQAERILFRNELSKPKEPRVPLSQAYVPQPAAPIPVVNEDFEDFLEENPWADSNSMHFDETLRSEADYLADYMRRGLTLSGETHRIGTKEFYDTIRDTIRSKYGIGGSINTEAPRPQSRTNHRPKHISPVNNMNNPYNSSGQNPVAKRSLADNLTPMQQQIAHSLPLYNANGTPKSDKEKRDHYAKQLMSQLQNQQRNRG